MSRQLQIGLVMVLITVGSLAFFVSTAREVRVSDAGESSPEFTEAEAPLYDAADPPLEVRIFFPTRSNDLLLRSRDVSVFASQTPENRARQIVNHLIDGSDDDLLFGQLPDGTRLNQIFVSDDGIAYLNFNSAISDNHPGGILREQATIYAIANSLIYNLSEVDRVKILVGGVERETLAGHCLLLLPFELDLSITDIIPGETA